MATTKTRILLIDDEIDCLNELKASLASKQDQWILEFSNNPQQALESILQDPPTVVICDYHMPQINGAELLREAEKAHPFLHRFIVAEREDLQILEDGIGSAFHYLPKPCQANRLESEIQRCLSIEKWLGKTQIKNIVGTLGELPSLPSLYLKIVEVLNDSDVSIEKVGKAISTDITISARILKIVNSSYFGFDETISDITQAFSVLGIETVKNLVLAIQVFNESEGGGQNPQSNRLWQHSMDVAIGARNVMMYETGSSRLAEGAYTSGLFHDIGKLIMQRAAPDAYQSAKEFAMRMQIPAWKAEDEVLGCNHAETGGYLLARWGLPIEVIESAVLHHEPVNSSGSSFSSLAAVYVANTILNNESANPESEYESSFISGLGRSDQWPSWKEVVTGEEWDESSSRRGSEKTEPESPPKTKWETQSTPANQASSPSSESGKPSRGSRKKLIVSGVCAAACVAFAYVLVTNNSDSDSFADWEQESFTTELSHLDSDFDSQRQGATEPISDEVLANDETGERTFDTVTAEGLVAESFGQPVDAIKFPKINLTKIYHDLPIPVANVNSRLVRIGDRVSGASIVDIDQRNVIVQYEGIRKSYSVRP